MTVRKGRGLVLCKDFIREIVLKWTFFLHRRISWWMVDMALNHTLIQVQKIPPWYALCSCWCKPSPAIFTEACGILYVDPQFDTADERYRTGSDIGTSDIVMNRTVSGNISIIGWNLCLYFWHRNLWKDFLAKIFWELSVHAHVHVHVCVKVQLKWTLKRTKFLLSDRSNSGVLIRYQNRR
jgi:hypothetical protein